MVYLVCGSPGVFRRLCTVLLSSRLGSVAMLDLLTSLVTSSTNVMVLK